MMEEIIRSNQFRHSNPDLDEDFLADYSFILGDLNYRFDSTYQDFVNSDLIKFANERIEDLDQLHKSMLGRDFMSD
jgi:hypothetical protein